MDHKDILERLGGPHKVHAALAEIGVKIQVVTVRSWALAERSIPAKYWNHLKIIADFNKVDLTIEMFAAGAAVERADNG
jgi:hypothetical protein